MSLGPAAIYAWLAKPGDGTGLAGGAFLLAPDLAVTCAHVVREHLDLGSVTPAAAPSQPVRLRFPALDLEREAHVVPGGWFHSPPAGGAEVLRDVAILRLAAPVEHAKLTCYPLATTRPRGGAHGRISGAGPGWQGHGQQVAVEVSMDPNFQGLWELTDRKGHGFATEQGFSGAPMFDDAAMVLLGMVQQVGEPGTRVTLALGADRLGEALRSAGIRLGGTTTSVAGAPEGSAAATVAQPERCLGREAELTDLVAALLAGGGTTALVLGEGGVGKTTLTREAATQPDIIARFGPRRHEVALATAASAAAMQDAIAGALGADPKQGMAGIRARLGAPTLLLLDNLETPWDAEAAATEALLRDLAGVPGLALLASIRGAESPRIRWRHRCDLSPLAEAAARALFLDIAFRIRPDDPDLAPLLAELAGLPLAIELVARQAEPDTALRRVMAAWRSQGPSLADGRADPDHRHASLARSIEVSLASPRLGEAGRRLFRLLGALPAGLAPEDEAPLLGEAAPDAVRQLRAVALARERDGRLDLLPPMRRHAAAKHPPTAEEQRAWIAHYLALAREQGGRVGKEGGAIAAARLRPELANLDAALSGATPAGLLGEAIGATYGYGSFGYLLGLGGNGPRALAAACRDAGDRLGEANCILRLADIALARSEHDAARQGYEAARTIYREISDRLGEAHCIQRLAEIALARSDHVSARQGYEAARTIHRAIGDRLGEANCIQGLAEIALRRSEHDAARQGYEAALPIYREIGSRLGEANCIQGLANIALVRSEHDAARQGYEAALPIYREIGSRLGEANCILRLAEIALARSEHDAARPGYEAALPIFREIGDRLGEANCIQGLADIALARSEHDAARQGYEAARKIYREIGARLGEANCIRGLADIAHARSEHDAARQGYAAALTIYREIGDVVGEAICIAGQGELTASGGDKAEARRRVEQAIALFEGVGSAGNVAWARGLIKRLGL